MITFDPKEHAGHSPADVMSGKTEAAIAGRLDELSFAERRQIIFRDRPEFHIEGVCLASDDNAAMPVKRVEQLNVRVNRYRLVPAAVVELEFELGIALDKESVLRTIELHI